MSNNESTPFTIDQYDTPTSPVSELPVVSPATAGEPVSAHDDHPVPIQAQTELEVSNSDSDQTPIQDQESQDSNAEIEIIKEISQNQDQDQDQVAVNDQKLVQDHDDTEEPGHQEPEKPLESSNSVEEIEEEEEEEEDDDDYDPEESFAMSSVSRPPSISAPLPTPSINPSNNNSNPSESRPNKPEISEELREQTNNSKNNSISNDSNEVPQGDSNIPGKDSLEVLVSDTNANVKQNIAAIPYQPASTIVPSSIPSNIDLQKVLASMTTQNESTSDELDRNMTNPLPTANLPTAITELSSGGEFDAGKASIPTPSELEALLAKYGSPLRDFNAIKSFYTPEQENIFEQFLQDEAEYLASGDWDRFPLGTRLFIGNLPTHPPINRRMIFKIFCKYGRICQISIKSTYAFIQFFEVKDCHDAIKLEATEPLFDEKLLLEISKPQSGRKHGSGVGQPQGFGSGHGKNHEVGHGGAKGRRIRSRSPPPYRRDSRGAGPSGRGGHRGRSPPPGFNNYRGNNNHGYRERSPPSRNSGGGRFGSQDNYDSALPYRPAHEVPECQIFLLDNRLDDQYIWSVERAFKDARFIFDVKSLPPRVPLKAAIQQMVREGVLGVVMLNYRLQRDNKVNVQVFDRSTANSGSSDGNGVRFDEYLGVDTTIAVELLSRARRQDRQTANIRLNHQNNAYDRHDYGSNHNQGHNYGQDRGHGYRDNDQYDSRRVSNAPYPYTVRPASYSDYNNRGSPPLPSPAIANPNSLASNLLGTLQNMDPATLQKVALALQQQQQPPNAQQPQSSMYGPNSAVNFSTNSNQPPYGGRSGVAAVPNMPYYDGAGSGRPSGAASTSAPGLPQTQPGGAHQVHNIMEQLAKLQGQMRPN
ncbi:hypothetical protein NADFUDRAFT_50239 [Nadsonia fulvescens var. elongata DSM 6958]|uniref:RRM domain-containing protein n=1 Tax=Nadsonia fulvescens var. elongata DSM 6958 TaxID=857566 RepID=A0A1E3PLL9_9ASCO|nr:hypothetical protein NADFUDRAFT_50239 [Nadsonia fulvescens var. elongata DSM 6958]